MASSVFTIANFFINKAREEGIPIDPLKLQKLIYIAHGWTLAFTGEPLIREHFEAWKYGPVVPELYQYFKEFRAGSITKPAQAPEERIPETESDILSQVWDKYKGLSATTLSSLTHRPGSAWRKTFDFEYSGWYRSEDIPNSLIRDEFVEELRATEAKRGEQA